MESDIAIQQAMVGRTFPERGDISINIDTFVVWNTFDLIKLKPFLDRDGLIILINYPGVAILYHSAGIIERGVLMYCQAQFRMQMPGCGMYPVGCRSHSVQIFGGISLPLVFKAFKISPCSI